MELYEALREDATSNSHSNAELEMGEIVGNNSEISIHSFEFDELKVGLTFSDYDSACSYIKQWCDINKMPLVKRDTARGNESTPGRLLFECPHATKRQYRTKGVREKRSVNFTDCKSRVNIYESKKLGGFRVTLCVTQHEGHLVGESVYGSYQTVRKLSEASQQKIIELDGVGASRKRVAEYMSDETGKRLVILHETQLMGCRNAVYFQGYIQSSNEVKEKSG